MWKSIETGLIRLLLLVDSVIYGLVSTLFSIFVDLANAKVFSDSLISSFTQRIYIIIGVLALFIVSYSLLNAVINPDNLMKGSNSTWKIIINLVTSIIMVTLLPSVFNFAYSAQNAILKDDIIGKLFLGTKNSEEKFFVEDSVTGEKTEVDSSYLVKQNGAHLSWTVLNAFLYKDPNVDGDDITADWSPLAAYKSFSDGASSTVGAYACGGSVLLLIGSGIVTYFSGGSLAATIPAAGKTLMVTCGLTIANSAAANIAYELTDEETNWNEMQYMVTLGDFTQITAFAENISDNDGVEYMPIISTVVGCILLWMVFSFCLDLGVRSVKLAFYQMLAPIPIFSRILPNNKLFNNWLRLTLTTFIEVFTRLIILYSVIFFASNISGIDFPGGAITKCIVVLGIITFARQLPKLISEITGIDSGNMKLGIMEKLGAGGALAGGALIGGGITAGVRNATNSWKTSRGQNLGKRIFGAAKSGIAGTASGAMRGAKSAGFKAKSWGDMKNAASSGATAAHDKHKKRAAYKADHGGTTRGVIKGRVSDAWVGVKNWAGAHADILDTVQFEDDYIGGYDDYSAIYNTGSYQAMDAQLNQLEARIASEGATAETYAGSGITLSDAKDNLKNQMRYSRLSAIEKNTDSAAYAAYNLARQVKNNPDIAKKVGVSADFVSIADDLILKNNKVVHKNGKEWNSVELQKLFEGHVGQGAVYDSSGKFDKYTASGKSTYAPGYSGLSSDKGAVRKQRTKDKNSIEFKEAKKAADKNKSN